MRVPLRRRSKLQVGHWYEFVAQRPNVELWSQANCGNFVLDVKKNVIYIQTPLCAQRLKALSGLNCQLGAAGSSTEKTQGNRKTCANCRKLKETGKTLENESASSAWPGREYLRRKLEKSGKAQENSSPSSAWPARAYRKLKKTKEAARKHEKIKHIFQNRVNAKRTQSKFEKTERAGKQNSTKLEQARNN